MVSDLFVVRGRTGKKPKKRKYPRAFWIVPVKLRTRVPKHGHVLGQAAIPPCPIGCRYAGKISIGMVSYCVYVDESGADFLIQC